MFSDASDDSAQSHPSSDVIRGSIGYVAPEYGMGVKVSMQGDVYSYGILLLEMFTRKRPTDDMFLNGLSLHYYAKMALPNQVMGIVDPLVLLEDDNQISNTVDKNNTRTKLEECLVSAITLAVTCSAEVPSERMTMSDVVSELLHTKKHYHDYSLNISD
ncbi:LRR receptor-like serine/threonine-protein kinase [Thalictrum thalictroides]|uniref:LRR receptor-like serine/threonine-protein kinase n=1 Tax=Thalictrum thalictroides TaxID=46969 RepID=A0A7J6V4R9_THATH|nr:LRR receptor-like serine/threonine-protein kinase [Thalictrum thalictroides]